MSNAGPSSSAMTTQQSTSTAALALAPTSSSSITKRLSTMNIKSDSVQHQQQQQPTNGAGAEATSANGTAGAGTGGIKDVVTPGELCGFVDTLLAQLETRFDEMSEQVLGRMNEMSTRIDNLENTISDLMHQGIDVGQPDTKA